MNANLIVYDALLKLLIIMNFIKMLRLNTWVKMENFAGCKVSPSLVMLDFV